MGFARCLSTGPVRLAQTLRIYARSHSSAAFPNVSDVEIRCAIRSQALDLTYESISWSACGLRRLLCLCALGSCPGGFLFWQRLLCAFILPVVRRLLRLSWLRVLQLLPELLRLRMGRLLSALVAPSLLRRVVLRGAGGVGGGRAPPAWAPRGRGGDGAAIMA